MVYRIFGAEPSPYSVKLRSYLRYKALPHEWVPRSLANEEEFRALAKLPLIPLLVTPEGEAMQDSTPVIEELERRHPEPALQPADQGLGFLSCLIEDYADEWGNKPMFHYRWTYEADQAHGAAWIAEQISPAGSPEDRASWAKMIRERMVPRLAFVGSHEGTREVIEGSYRRQLRLLEAHLAVRPYLFGGRPCLADFGWWGQLYELSIDPTPGALMRETAPHVVAYVERMLHPVARGGFETWASLAATLMPVLREEVAGLFLPWSDANARALARGDEQFTVELEGAPFTQSVQKYHAKALGVLRARFAALDKSNWVMEVLESSGCRAFLEGERA